MTATPEQPSPSTWYEVEAKLYGQSHWRMTTALAGGIKDGFSSPEAAQDFITLMARESGDLLYRDAQWRIIRCERSVVSTVDVSTSSPPAVSADAEDQVVANTEVDDLAAVLIDAWERAENRKVNPSYVATFADIARRALVEGYRRVPAPLSGAKSGSPASLPAP